MYTYYRMKGSRKLLAMYRCEHCGRVALHAVALQKETTYNPTWTRNGLERRRARKEEELTQRMDKAAASLSESGNAMAFLGKKVEGECPHCGKKQAWMRMSYGLWGQLVGVMAMIVGFGFFSMATFEGRRSQFYTLRDVTAAMTAVTILLALALVIHAAVMIARTRRACQENPVLLAREAEELMIKAAQHPAYVEAIKKGV